MVNGFIKPETKDGPCALYLGEYKDVVKNIADKMRSMGDMDDIYLVRDSHAEDDVELERFPRHCMAETEESDLIEELDSVIHSGDVNCYAWDIPKTTMNALYNTTLESSIAHNTVGRAEIEVCGCCTEWCILSTVIGLYALGYDVVIDRNCIISANKENGEMALKLMENCYGVKVVN